VTASKLFAVEAENSAEAEVPVWARAEAFPVKPTGHGDFGYIDSRRNLHAASDADELAQKIGHARQTIGLVWSPDSDRLVVPEEIAALHKPLRARQRKQAEQDLSDGKRMGLVFGAITLWTLYAAWTNGGRQLEALYTHQLTGLAIMLFFIFGALPFYQGWKLKRHLAQSQTSDLTAEIPDARFDVWLHRQAIPATWFLLVLMLLCGVVQAYFDWADTLAGPSIIQAGLLKQVALQYPEQADGSAWWRMLSAPMIHGNAIHFLMNAGGLLYLGRRTEILARWPHMLIVFVAACWAGGVATSYWIPDKISVGASGGLMGLLGFLLAFEFLHHRLVPRPAKRRLIAGLIMMFVIGVLGMSFIDNAVHAGGLLMGMGYALIVFPTSASAQRPNLIKRDLVAGVVAGIVILGAACLTCFKVLW